jgi:Tol biopolymer transport system component
MPRLLVVLALLLALAGGAWLIAGSGDDERPASPGESAHREGVEEAHEEGEEEEEEEVSNIFLADVRTGKLERLTANKGEERSASSPAWVPDGGSLLYTQVPCDDCQPFVEAIGIAESARRARRVAEGSLPAMFADGRRFAFLGRKGGVYLGEGGRRDVRRLAPPSRPWDEPAPSPDGRHVLAVTQGPGGGARLALLGVRGGRPRLLPPVGRSIANPTWSPDGRRIAFAALGGDGLWRLHTARPDGRGRRPLSRPGESDTDPVWSRNGSRLAFVRVRAGQPEVFVAAADGSGARPVLRDGVQSTQPAWSPDGRRLAVTMKGYEVPEG